MLIQTEKSLTMMMKTNTEIVIINTTAVATGPTITATVKIMDRFSK